jgi:hypothetical protein
LKTQTGHENWGVDSSSHSLKKEANWVEFIQLIPKKDPFYEKTISKLRNKHKHDELLVAHAKFLEFNDEEVLYSTDFPNIQPRIFQVC